MQLQQKLTKSYPSACTDAELLDFLHDSCSNRDVRHQGGNCAKESQDQEQVYKDRIIVELDVFAQKENYARQQDECYHCG